MSHKAQGSDLHFSNALTTEKGLYGYYWAKKVKGDKLALPSLFEVVDGLYKFYTDIVKEKCKSMDGKALSSHLQEVQKAFGIFYSFLDSDAARKPLT